MTGKTRVRARPDYRPLRSSRSARNQLSSWEPPKPEAWISNARLAIISQEISFGSTMRVIEAARGAPVFRTAVLLATVAGALPDEITSDDFGFFAAAGFVVVLVVVVVFFAMMAESF